MDIFTRYSDNVLGVISDLGFPKVPHGIVRVSCCDDQSYPSSPGWQSQQRSRPLAFAGGEAPQRRASCPHAVVVAGRIRCGAEGKGAWCEIRVQRIAIAAAYVARVHARRLAHRTS
eukprot:5596109-Prymnesium_polylepis.1